MRVMIDPGHTGVSDPGAVSINIREADVTLDVALRLKGKLAGIPGLQLRLTREQNRDLATPYTQAADLTVRTNMANAWPADLFLSLHCNAAATDQAHGYETFVHNNASAESRRVAQIIHGHLAKLFRADRGLKTANFHVLRETRMPAVLVEMGFVTNRQDREQLQRPQFRQELADAIYVALLEAYPDLRPPATPPPAAGLTPIIGAAVASLGQAQEWLRKRAPDWTHLADLYWQIAPRYGVRPDVALCQAVKETGAFKFGGLVAADQNNFCGLGATGTPNTADTPLRGADPKAVKMEPGRHGATFATPEVGVEAHVQHLYAYATTDPLPPWATLYSPRFALVSRGIAPVVEYLGAAENPAGQGWAYPGTGYGASIVSDYLGSLLATPAPSAPVIPGDDWKARALAAEAELRRMRDEIYAILERVK